MPDEVENRQHYGDTTIAKQLADGTQVLSTYVDEDRGEKLVSDVVAEQAEADAKKAEADAKKKSAKK